MLLSVFDIKINNTLVVANSFLTSIWHWCIGTLAVVVQAPRLCSSGDITWSVAHQKLNAWNHVNDDGSNGTTDKTNIWMRQVQQKGNHADRQRLSLKRCHEQMLKLEALTLVTLVLCFHGGHAKNIDGRHQVLPNCPTGAPRAISLFDRTWWLGVSQCPPVPYSPLIWFSRWTPTLWTVTALPRESGSSNTKLIWNDQA